MAENIHANEGPRMLAEFWTLLPLAIIVVFLRFLARRVSKAGLWWDDWLAAASVFVCAVEAALNTAAVAKFGFGQHVQVVGLAGEVGYLKSFLADAFCYTFILTFAKLSICFYFLRISTSNTIKWPIWIVAIIVFLWGLGTLITSVTQCIPLDALWNPTKGHCVNTRNTFLGNSIPNVCTDFFLLVLSIPFIWRRNLKTWQKAGVALAFALGNLVFVISIVRLVVAVVDFNGGNDPTWTFVALHKWSVAEMYLTPTTASLPILGPLFQKSKQPSSGGLHDISSADGNSTSSNMKSQPEHTTPTVVESKV